MARDGGERCKAGGDVRGSSNGYQYNFEVRRKARKRGRKRTWVKKSRRGYG